MSTTLAPPQTTPLVSNPASPGYSDSGATSPVGTSFPTQPSVTPAVTLPTTGVGVQVSPQGGTFTEEDMARARQQEKDKLYSELEALKATTKEQNDLLAQLKADAEARRKAEEDAAAAQEQAAREAELAELSAVDRIRAEQEDWNRTIQAELEAEKAARLQAEAIASKEREFGELRDYTLQRIEQSRDKIGPELVPLIGGNTKDEVEDSIQRAIAATSAILESIRPQEASSEMTPAPTQAAASPFSGPANFDPSSQYTQLTPEAIAGMSIKEYAQIRGRLPGISGSQNNKGMYG